MSAVKRKIGINLTAGIAIAIIVFAAIFASGIYLPKATGTVVVSIKDAPVELEELWITVNSIQIQKSEDESWIDLTLDQAPATFDLLALTGDNSLKLSQDDVDTGDYTKIRLDVKNAVATYIDSNEEDISEELTVPPGHIDIMAKFTVEAGTVTGLLIDMQPDITAISQSGNFRPIIKASVTPIIPTPTPSPSPSPTPPP